MSWSEYWGEKNWLAEARSDNESPAIDDWREGERDWKQRSVACKLDFLLYLLNAKTTLTIIRSAIQWTSTQAIIQSLKRSGTIYSTCKQSVLRDIPLLCIILSHCLTQLRGLCDTSPVQLRYAESLKLASTTIGARSLYFQSFLELLSTWILCFSTSFPYPRSWYSSINFE